MKPSGCCIIIEREHFTHSPVVCPAPDKTPPQAAAECPRPLHCARHGAHYHEAFVGLVEGSSALKQGGEYPGF